MIAPRLRRCSQPSSTKRSRSRSLSIETLEVREVMSAVPLTIVNDSTVNTAGALAYQDNQIWVAIYAQQEETGAFYYFTQNGTATSVAGKSTVPAYLLSSFTAVSGQDHTFVINMPDTMPSSTFGPKGARMYFGMGSKPVLEIASNEVQPNALTNQYFDFVEFTINGKGPGGGALNNLNIDTTSVDQFGVPLSVAVDTTTTDTTVGISATRASVIQQYRTFTSGPNDTYALTIWPEDGAHGPYRLENPSDYLLGATTQNTTMQVQANLSQPLYAKTTETSVYVFSTDAFPPNPTASSPFYIKIDNEEMKVTNSSAGPGGTVKWTVERAVNGTSLQAHAIAATVTPAGVDMTSTQVRLTMANTTGYPDPNKTQFYVKVDEEIMKVVKKLQVNQNGTTTWMVKRGQFGSTATSHTGAGVYYNSLRGNGFNNKFNKAIDDLFMKYLKVDAASPKLLLKSNANEEVYEGQVVHSDEMAGTGPMVLRFRLQSDPMGSQTYDVYYPFFVENHYFWGGYTPKLQVNNAPTEVKADSAGFSPSAMVFGCEGVFADSGQRTSLSAADQAILGDLENQVVAALNRGVALIDDAGTDSWKQTEYYYGVTPHANLSTWNRYAEFLHRDSVSIDGKNYGFAFDDNNQQASDIGVGDLSDLNSTTITLKPWATGTSQKSADEVSTRDLLGSGQGGLLASSSTTTTSESLSQQSLALLPTSSTLLLPTAGAVDAALESTLELDGDEALVLDDDEVDAIAAPQSEEAPATVRFSLRAYMASRR